MTTSGAVPRAIGYIWPKSPSVNDRISSSMYTTCRAADAIRYGQASVAGNGTKRAAAAPISRPPPEIRVKDSSWSLIACAMAFQLGVREGGRQDGYGDQRRHLVCSRTSTTVPPACPISVCGSSGKTVYGVPAAAHTVACASSPRSARTRVLVRCPKGGTPPIA